MRPVLSKLPDSTVGLSICSKNCRSSALNCSARITLSDGAQGWGDVPRSTSQTLYETGARQCGVPNECQQSRNFWRSEPNHARHSLSLIHISEPTRLGMISYAVFCLKKK